MDCYDEQCLVTGSSRTHVNLCRAVSNLVPLTYD